MILLCPPFLKSSGSRALGGDPVRGRTCGGPSAAAVVGKDGGRVSRHAGVPHRVADLPPCGLGVFVRRSFGGSWQHHLRRYVAGTRVLCTVCDVAYDTTSGCGSAYYCGTWYLRGNYRLVFVFLVHAKTVRLRTKNSPYAIFYFFICCST